MDHIESGKYWNDNAEAWTQLARAGFDIYRDYINTPAFFEILPDITGLHGIDIGCGEGHNTRLLAQKGAMIDAIDISENFIQKAIDFEKIKPLNIQYQIASAVALPFNDKTFDFATAFMSFMDIPETEKVLSEAYRVLKQKGFLQFSISHPCFNTAHKKNLRDNNGKTYAVEVGDYYNNLNGRIDEWLFKAAPSELKLKFQKFKTPVFTKTLSQWVNAIIEAGFVIEYIHEPFASDEIVRKQPKLQDSQVVAYFLHVRCIKP